MMTELKNQEYQLSQSPAASYWKQKLTGKMPKDWEKEINEFETQMILKKKGKVDDKVFAETRLRRGAYGQRYDNGQRHDGKENRPIVYPNQNMTKGPMTLWDAPGMERIKIPYGGMSPNQMDVLADLAEEYSDSICHITTRQDIQLHYVHIEDTPSLFRRLASVDITTREACGNSVRNVTACPLAGVCADHAFDVTPYAEVMFRFCLGHPDVQDFGRKFKIAFSGCKDQPCGLTGMHDLGLIAKKKIVNGKETRGFEYYVGGGLGAVPYQAKLFDDFVPEEEMLALSQAVFRIYARYGEKKNRNRARIKFLVNDWGIDKFREMVLEERKKIKSDPRWKDYQFSEKEETKGAYKPGKAIKKEGSKEYLFWLQNNVYSQKQGGYAVVHISLPLGDITSNQMRDLADIARKYVGDAVRTTVEQNIVLRWVNVDNLPPLYQELKKIDLVEPYAGTIVDVTSCPGTDTCKLGVASSRGLSGELRRRLAEKSYHMDAVVRGLHIKVSGCFNSCGQQHVADIGFYGISRKKENYLVPHFQLVLGGEWTRNAGSYGLPIAAFPSKAIPKVVDRLTDMYLKMRQGQEIFKDFVKRLGKVEIKKALEDLAQVPPYTVDPSYYVDWADVREFTTSDIGKGECAGEIVSLVDFGLAAADREVFEAQIAFDKRDFKKALQGAHKAMRLAAQGLIKGQNPDISDKPEDILQEFQTRFCDTQLFYDTYAGDKFAKYLFMAHQPGGENLREDQISQRIQEAGLFIEAAYSCYAKMSMAKAS